MEQLLQHISSAFRIPLQNPVLVFSLILLIILLAPILFRRFNIPSIIVLIISGVIIGPHGFNVLEKNSAIELFSTIGLLYIMFIAGLDLDLNKFKTHKHKSLIFGLFTFIIPISIGYPVCFYFLGYESNSSLLTASMFATHTLIAYPIVSKLGVSKNQAVAITVGGTILTDTAVLILLAVIIGKHQGSLDSVFWIKLFISLALLFFIMFKIIPILSKWFFRKLESEKHSHYIFVLAILFFSAFMAEMAGVEPIIGAFIAGLALNRLIPHSSALMNRIEFIGNALFIPFFLISVGMIVNVNIIFNGTEALIVTGTLTIVALFGKWLAALFTQLIFGYSAVQRNLIFGLSSSHAAATLAIILVGYKAGILDANILNGTVILILITCIVASFVTERSAKKIVISMDLHQNSDKLLKLKSEHLLMPISAESHFEKLLEFTLLIKDEKSANPVTVLTVIPNNKDAEMELLLTRQKLENCVKHASDSESKVNIVTALDFNISSGIVRTAREIMADIIIMGWPGQTGLIDKLIGENTDSLLKATNKTMFMCKIIKPLITHKHIILIAPPFCEKENGFLLWFNKVSKLSQELSLPITFFCNQKSQIDIIKILKKEHINLVLNFKKFEEWEDFLILSRYIKPEDLVIFASARKGSASYISILEQIPLKLEKHFADNNKIVIYPQQFENQSKMQGFDNISSEPLNKGLEGVQKISKNIGNIFKKETEEIRDEEVY